MKIEGVNCPAIDGILEEAEEIAGEVDDKTVLDAALIAAAQAVEHYEMTRYGTLIAWAATATGRPDCAALLEQNLKEEEGGRHEAHRPSRARHQRQELPNKGSKIVRAQTGR